MWGDGRRDRFLMRQKNCGRAEVMWTDLRRRTHTESSIWSPLLYLQLLTWKALPAGGNSWSDWQQQATCSSEKFIAVHAFPHTASLKSVDWETKIHPFFILVASSTTFHCSFCSGAVWLGLEPKIRFVRVLQISLDPVATESTSPSKQVRFLH